MLSHLNCYCNNLQKHNQSATWYTKTKVNASYQFAGIVNQLGSCNGLSQHIQLQNTTMVPTTTNKINWYYNLKTYHRNGNFLIKIHSILLIIWWEYCRLSAKWYIKIFSYYWCYVIRVCHQNLLLYVLRVVVYHLWFTFLQNFLFACFFT